MIAKGRAQRRLVLGVTSPLTVEFLLAPVLPYLIRDDWDVHVVTSPGVPDGVLPAAVTSHSINMDRSITPVADTRALGEWVRLLRRVKPDIVVGGTPKAALLSMIAARAVGVPTRVFQLRGARWDGHKGASAQLLRRADQIAARCATDVLAVSDSLADLMVSEGLVRKRPVVLGRGGSKGVDTSVFTPRTLAPAGATGAAGKPVVGFLGRLSSDKGISDFLDVYDLCRLSHPDLRATVAGEVDDSQPIGPEVIDRFRSLGVTWQEWSSRPAPILQSFDILLYPSLRDGLPNVVIEAAACGVPTVGYDTTGVRDAVVNGQTGLLVPLGDRAALARATRRLLDDQALRARMSAAALEFARENFAQAKVAAAFANWLRQVTDGQAGDRTVWLRPKDRERVGGLQ